jgi:Tfp pilus assembly protein PilV
LEHAAAGSTASIAGGGKESERMSGSMPSNKPSRSRSAAPRSSRRSRGGFTLIEAALTTIIVGTGVLAIMSAQQAYLQKNDWSERSATGLLLANEVRELTLRLPAHDPISGDANLGAEANESAPADFDDLDDFAGVIVSQQGEGLTFSPPINALAEPIADLPGWSQQINVESVLPSNISTTFVQPLGSTPMMRVTVLARYQGPGMDSPETAARLVWVVPER